MEAAQVGVIRDSMLANPLLIRADLGRSRSRAFTLPGKEFVFGKPNVTTDGGVPEVMSHWSTLVPVTHSDSKPRKAGQDFMALNREAVKSGLVTAHEHYQFRATHDVKLRPPKVEARLDRSPPDITFGVHTRPSTPIFDLLEQRYQQRWLEECRSAQKASQAKEQKKVNSNALTLALLTVPALQIAGAEGPVCPGLGVRDSLPHRVPERGIFLSVLSNLIKIVLAPSTPIFDLLEQRYQQRWLEECRSAQKASQAKEQKKTKLGKIYETRTSLLRQSQPSVEPRPLWQLPRFQKVGPHLETFRNPEARKKAFSSHFSDSVARCGLQGQGMYTTS
ncbi:UNVERIFIED_CONTAM: hypothetical protein FKN15_022413 [Acipenser sinensis]